MQFFSIDTQVQVSYEALVDIISVGFLQGACGSWATIGPSSAYIQASDVHWSNTNQDAVEDALVNVYHPEWEVTLKDFQGQFVKDVNVTELVNAIQTIADKFPAHFHMIKNNNITPDLSEMVIQYAMFGAVRY